MNRSSILNSRIYPRIGLDNASTINKYFEINNQYRGNLAEQLLLYDKIVFPTNDFGILSMLNNWLGYNVLIEALENDIFSFVRSKGIMIYFNRGQGINFIIAKESPQKEFLWWQHAMFGDFEKAIELQLTHSTTLKPNEIKKIIPLVIQKSKELTFDSGYYKSDFAKETYKDIQESPTFIKYFFDYYKRNDKDEKIDLLNLPGLNADQGRVSAIAPIKDPIDLLLRLAETNLEISISSFMGGIDIFTSEGANQLLSTKFKRLGYTSKQIDGFITLLDLNNIPDIEIAISKNVLSFEDIWKFRNTNDSKQFRSWLRKISLDDLRELERMYVSCITKKNVIDKIPSKVLRFCITTAIGFINPLLGLATSALDTFGINKLNKEYNPKLFFDKLRNLNTP
jgi:hypothetical protein